MKKLVLMLLCAAAAWGCSSPTAYTIKGEIEGAEGYLYLVDNTTQQRLDSVAIRGGRFVLKGEAAEPFLAHIHTEMPDALPAGESFYTVIIVEPGTITVQGKAGQEQAAIGGTPSNEGLKAYFAYNDELREKVDAYGDRMMEREVMEQLNAEYDAAIDAMLAANHDNYFGAVLLQREKAYDMSAAEIIDEIERFPAALQQTALLTALRGQAEAKARTDVGRTFIDIAQPDPDGKVVTLASVVENRANKYVLVDFWASWCGPCMGEVPYLLEAYANYRKKGFEIYGVSFDRSAQSWRRAIEQEKMNWVQVSDVTYFDNQAARDYAIQAIPSNVLIDCATGTIVAKNLRGEALGEKLAELLD